MMFRRTSFAVILVAAFLSTTCNSTPLTAPTNSTITLTAGTRVLPIGGSTQLTAEVIEQAGTPVQNGTTVRFTTTLGRVDPAEAQTRNGVATATFFAGDDSGIADVRATSGAANAGSTTTPPPSTGGTGTTTTTPSSANVVQISVGAASIETVTVRANPATVSQSGGTVQVVATVTGTNGRSLPNLVVNFSATHGTLSSGSAITDAAGEARVSLTTNADTEISATAGTKKSETPAKVTATAPPSVTLTCAVGATNNCASVSTGDTVTFTASRASASSVISSSTLDFGDGQSESLGSLSSPVSIAHRYNQAGTYTARLTASDINGETTTTSSVITVTDLVATISLSVTNTVTRTVQATATLSATGSTISRYEWTFAPDGNPATLTTTTNSATSSFASAGNKTVSVRVVLTDGRSAQASGQIQVP
ncbi:MAG TPA: Ig-like domain-containing protein [Vicinamibacterales bacterium]|nr:Ig-like domain-containing protein [Vicinamibacterales bacterium]